MRLSGYKTMEIKCLPTNLCQKSAVANSLIDIIDSQPNCDRSLSILDLNDDCLEVIFMNFDLKQLFNVIVTHPHFSIACRRIISKRYKYKEVTFHANDLKNPEVFYFIGDIVQRVRVNYDQNNAIKSVNNRKMHDAIVQHCSNTLIEATFNNIESTQHVNRVFHRLQQLKFNHGSVGPSLTQFNKWFPNLNRLELFFCEIIDKQCIEHSFLQLQHFTVAHHNFTLRNLQKFLDLNPQLQTFTVYSYNRALISQLDAFTRLKFKSLTTKFEIYPCYFAFDTN